MSPSEYEIREHAMEQKYREWKQANILAELPPTHPLKRAALAEKRKRLANQVFGRALILLAICGLSWLFWTQV